MVRVNACECKMFYIIVTKDSMFYSDIYSKFFSKLIGREAILAVIPPTPRPLNYAVVLEFLGQQYGLFEDPRNIAENNGPQNGNARDRRFRRGNNEGRARDRSRSRH